MIYFKSCPRCSGDLSLEQDVYGWYLICLSCSNVLYPNIDEEEKKKTAVVKYGDILEVGRASTERDQQVARPKENTTVLGAPIR